MDTIPHNQHNSNSFINSQRDDIVRKMDDSMSGPNAGILSVLPFLLPINANKSNQWEIRRNQLGERRNRRLRLRAPAQRT